VLDKKINNVSNTVFIYFVSGSYEREREREKETEQTDIMSLLLDVWWNYISN
jgi:hypothetical protein